MRLARGVYEGPGSHGILRVAAGMRGVHAVLRGFPGEGYFPALYSTRGRTGEAAPVTLSPVREGRGDDGGPDAPWPPGSPNLARDLAGAVRRHPAARTFVVARSEAVLLSGEGVPDVPLPENGAGAVPKLVACPWEAPGMGEVEAAELALDELVRAHAGGPSPGKTPSPTVNLFGPPLFGPGAASEYAEAERLLALIGVGVNARVPLGTSPAELSRLPTAWASVLLYREVGESATLFLQDEFGVGRVTTPMVGAAGTGAALRAVGELCRLDPAAVQRAIWAELAGTAKLPWYARLAPPETFRGRRAAVFGDFTYPLGLGHTLAREVGLEVVACGTYLTHLQRDFLFHANTFTDGAFVEDDPDSVASRIEAARPDLVVGTDFEEGVAASLGVPFLPLCAPVADQPFAGRPLMGYAGSGVLADMLDRSLKPSRRAGEGPSVGAETVTPWTDAALQELERMPPLLKGRARRLAEERARASGSPEVTPEIFRGSRL